MIRRLVLASFVLGAWGSTGCDPVTDDAIAALGPEAPGVRRGPLHRPGQPCLLCHDGSLGDPPQFVVAGTVYATPNAAVGLDAVLVTLHDSAGTTMPTTTNTAGNFYVTPDQWSPVFPLKGITVESSFKKVTMLSDVGGNGGCATCHVEPAGPTSPGRVCMSLDDGGTPP